MSTACQCDRCNKLFKPHLFAGINVIKIGNRTLTNDLTNTLRNIDLCDSCFEEFSNWLNKYEKISKEKENTSDVK